MTTAGGGPRLRGRRSEREAFDRLVARVRAGQSAVLVVRGEAGIGKTALLDYLADHAPDCRIVRAVGVEAEMALPFAGLHQLIGGCPDGLGHLPEPQRDALRVAFGLTKGAPPDRFLVGLAVLSQLAEVAAEQPLICLVDDAQWLDHDSAQTLGFVARRLLAESVGLVFAVREPCEQRAFDQLPELTVGGLGPRDARALLDSVVPGKLDERIRSRILAESHGNPLALLELGPGSTMAERAGVPRPDARLLASHVEQNFVRRVQALPPETQRLLLVAAAEPVGDVSLLWRAAEQLGIGMDAAAPALAAGLLDLGTLVQFRHPLVRSAAYRAADLADRYEAHRTLAEATDPTFDPDRRAWHRASATVGADEVVAIDLVRSADRARARGGVAAAAAFLERAMELTPDPAVRSTRALAAAQAKFEAGAADSAYQLATIAELGTIHSELDRARLGRLHAQILFARNRGSEATDLFLRAAGRFEPLDQVLARETYLEALAAAVFVGRLGAGDIVRQSASAALAAPRTQRPPRPLDLLLDGVTTRCTAGYAAGVEPLRKALRAFLIDVDDPVDDTARWLWMACPVAPEPVAPELWDDEAWHELASRAVGLARNAGALAALPIALAYRAGVHLQAGEFADASALIDEADAIAAATGNAPLRYTSLLLVAWRDDEPQALTSIQASVRTATSQGEGRAIGLASYVTAVLFNGLTRYDAAFEHAQEACEYEDLGFFGWYLVELVEAGVRCGKRDTAETAAQRLIEITDAAGTDWALGMQARARALLSDGDTADQLYRTAIERLGRTRIRVELARAHLLYGEWLRRNNRRTDARRSLRTAHEMFTEFGAGAFTERTKTELLAIGETVNAPAAATPAALTAREAQIAQLARDGHTNPEIGAQLFLSPHTVEWHLRKVFAKLGITSRRQLRKMFPQQPHFSANPKASAAG